MRAVSLVALSLALLPVAASAGDEIAFAPSDRPSDRRNPIARRSPTTTGTTIAMTIAPMTWSAPSRAAAASRCGR